MVARLNVEMVAVGHGDCFVLQWQPEQGEPATVVIDGGPRGAGTRLNEALSNLGVPRVDLMVLSHTDADHVDGLLEFAGIDDRPPISRYWGPCLPAFRRHDWLFAERVSRGLSLAEDLEARIRTEARISYPVEHATWQSEDGGLSIRVLSPAGRLIERLLLGDDAVPLFLQTPMPLGWLLDTPSTPRSEDAFADLRAAIRSGEIDPGRIPLIPASSTPSTREELVAEAFSNYGIEPEFFGNSVLNDTSLVLLVETFLDGATKRLLFTGDIQNFTYLISSHPMGLGCEVVKAPHHGSRSHIGEKLEAYDEVWQWLRPRAVLVSASGKHGLPRAQFRNAALRYGASLFCACRRSGEILVGEQQAASCHKQFHCVEPKLSVRLDITATSFVTNAQACATAPQAGPLPIIQAVQHLVDPSAILDRMTVAERDKHVRWAAAHLRNAHEARRATGGQPGWAPCPSRPSNGRPWRKGVTGRPPAWT